MSYPLTSPRSRTRSDFLGKKRAFPTELLFSIPIVFSSLPGAKNRTCPVFSYIAYLLDRPLFFRPLYFLPIAPFNPLPPSVMFGSTFSTLSCCTRRRFFRPFSLPFPVDAPPPNWQYFFCFFFEVTRGLIGLSLFVSKHFPTRSPRVFFF